LECFSFVGLKIDRKKLKTWFQKYASANSDTFKKKKIDKISSNPNSFIIFFSAVLPPNLSSTITSELQRLQSSNNYKNYKSSASHQQHPQHHHHPHLSHPSLLSSYTSNLFRNSISDASDLHNIINSNNNNHNNHGSSNGNNNGNHAANTKRKRSWSRAVFSNLQRKGLERQFEVQKYITKPDRRKLAARLGLTDAQVCYYTLTTSPPPSISLKVNH
jgi:hypothetical protein